MGPALDYGLKQDLQRRLFALFQDVSGSRSFGGTARFAVGSTIGPQRQENQDRAAVATVRFENGMMANVALICDGMGGLFDGGGAASKAISAFLSAITTAPNVEISQVLWDAVNFANQSVFDKYGGEGGTTLTAVIATEGSAWAVHVGDSRIYGFAEQTGLELLTRDDTVQGAINIHGGGGDEDELDNRLLQFVGLGEGINPHIFQLDMIHHEYWILSSDGAHVVGRNAIGDIAKGARGPADIVRKIIAVAEAFGTDDNASVACLPTNPNFPEVAFSGTNLTLWSPAKYLEVWLPKGFANSAASQRISRAEPEVDNTSRKAKTSPKRESATKKR